VLVADFDDIDPGEVLHLHVLREQAGSAASSRWAACHPRCAIRC